MNDSPRQDPAYRKSIYFTLHPKYSKVKLFLALLLIPSFLFAQEQPEREVHEFDGRCLSPVRWSATLIAARRNGTTHDEVVTRMANDYNGGSLSGYHPETLLYMLEIVDVVFTTESVQTDLEILDVLRVVESLCIIFVEDHASKPTNPTKEQIST